MGQKAAGLDIQYIWIGHHRVRPVIEVGYWTINQQTTHGEYHHHYHNNISVHLLDAVQLKEFSCYSTLKAV